METTSFTYKTGPCSDVLIIGGGLAGMYSALAAAESGAAVRILCKSKTGGSGNSVVAMSVHRFAPDAPGLREDYRRRFLASGAGQQMFFLFYDAVRFTLQWAWSGRTSPQWPCGSGRRTASPGRQRRWLPAPDPYLRGNCG